MSDNKLVRFKLSPLGSHRGHDKEDLIWQQFPQQKASAESSAIAQREASASHGRDIRESETTRGQPEDNDTMCLAGIKV